MLKKYNITTRSSTSTKKAMLPPPLPSSSEDEDDNNNSKKVPMALSTSTDEEEEEEEDYEMYPTQTTKSHTLPLPSSVHLPNYWLHTPHYNTILPPTLYESDKMCYNNNNNNNSTSYPY